MAIGDKIFVADKETLDKAKNIVDNIQYIVKKSTAVPAPPTPDKDYVADKETLDEMYTTLDGITTFSLNGNATTAQVLSGRTFFSNSPTRQTGTMANRSTQTSTSSYTNATFRSGTTGYVFCSPSVTGYYSTSSYLRVPVSNLSAANIKYNVNVGGIQGTYTNDGTATAGDLGVGKIAYSKGTRLVGTGENIQFSLVLQSYTFPSNTQCYTLTDVATLNNRLALVGYGGRYSANSSDYSRVYINQTTNTTNVTEYGYVAGENFEGHTPYNIVMAWNNTFIYGNGSTNEVPTSLQSYVLTTGYTSNITLPNAIDNIYGITTFNNKIILSTDDGFYYATSDDGDYTKATVNGNTYADWKKFVEINNRLYTAVCDTGYYSYDVGCYTDDGITWNTFNLANYPGIFITDYATNTNNIAVITHSHSGFAYRIVGTNLPVQINQRLDFVDYCESNSYFYGSYNNTLYRSSDGNSWSSIYTFTGEQIEGQFMTSDMFIITTLDKSYSFNILNNTAIEIPKIPLNTGIYRKPYGTMNGYKVSLINDKNVAFFK